jgi:hypothetical protein
MNVVDIQFAEDVFAVCVNGMKARKAFFGNLFRG